MTNDFAEANAFLMGGAGGRSASFASVGDSVVGLVMDVQVRQRTNFTTGEPEFWNDGKPKMLTVITLQTEEQVDDEDDGVRRVYAKGDMQKAIAKAIQSSDQRGLAMGGKLGIKFYREDPPEKKGMSPTKRYSAKYEPPVQTFDVDSLTTPDEEPPLPDDLPF